MKREVTILLPNGYILPEKMYVYLCMKVCVYVRETETEIQRMLKYFVELL